MFHGLSADGTRLVLQSCEFRGVRSGESVCRVNAQSDEMYILLSGQLGVYNEDQILLASINPVAPPDRRDGAHYRTAALGHG